MKKVTFTLFLIGSIFITMLTLNAVSFLSNLRTPPAGLNISQLLHGQFLQLLALKEYWANFPNLPALSMLFLPNALIVMLLLIGSVIYYLEYRQQAQPQITGAALLLTAMIPYGIGQLVLLGNGKLENAGVWLAFMLTGVFYAALSCALFSAYQILKNRKPVLAKN